MDNLSLLDIAMRIVPVIIGVLAIVVTLVMFSISRRFGTGILSAGFRAIAHAFIYISAGLLIHGITMATIPDGGMLTMIFHTIAYLLIIIGMALILKASKDTADKMQILTK